MNTPSPKSLFPVLAGFVITAGLVALAVVGYRQLTPRPSTVASLASQVSKETIATKQKESTPAPSASTRVVDLRGKHSIPKEDVEFGTSFTAADGTIEGKALPTFVGAERKLPESGIGRRSEKLRESRNPRYEYVGTVPKVIPQSIRDLPAVENRKFKEHRLDRARGTFTGDVRSLPVGPPVRRDRPEHEAPLVVRRTVGEIVSPLQTIASTGDPSNTPQVTAPAPTPTSSFDGLDFLNWGAGRPPDTVGDVGPNYFIQAVNTSIGIYRKSDGIRVAAFTFNTLMSQGRFGNLCDTDNFGDPVVLYDTFEDRWILTDFAFKLDSAGAVVNPPGAYQCFAVSKSGDPVAGGWNFYSLHITDGLNDYPKFGIWPDGIYMSANMFGFQASAPYLGTRVWALNKAQMYAGVPNIQVVSFNPPRSEFTLIPANARLQTGTPPAGSPNYFSTLGNFLNAVTVYKFHVDWNRIGLSSFTGPFLSITPTSWPNSGSPATVPSQGGNNNDTLLIRTMMPNLYTNLNGVESLWFSHTVQSPFGTTIAAPRYYQANITGGILATTTIQSFTHAPDDTNRYMPSVAVDRAGNMAIGYSASSATLFPAVRYAGRLAGDPVNTLGQTEQSLVEGTGSQNRTTRWGDYSAMNVAPDGCTFWFTSEYYKTVGSNWQTRVGSFTLPGCNPIGSGTVSGTVIASADGRPIQGATVTLGSRSTITNSTGSYQFLGVPAGTYPVANASAIGFNASSVANLLVNEIATTTQNFVLSSFGQAGCITDTSQSDFQTGLPIAVDLSSSAGDLLLSDPAPADVIYLAGTNIGTAFTTTSWGGQTFIPAVSGKLAKVDVQLFCLGCTGTTPNLTVSVRGTNNGLPVGPDLATATITGFNSGSIGTYTATFALPASLVSGTQYALLLRPTSNPSAGSYDWVRASPGTYANGSRVITADSGVTWNTDTTRDFNFVTYMDNGFVSTGTFTSSVKDSNPTVGNLPTWTTISWTASTSASTAVKFQVAGSNDPNGPFSFVGPDGTAATFFSNGGSLSQFNDLRYLKYQATLTTTDNTQTPTVRDVTLCYSDLPLTGTMGGGGTFCAGSPGVVTVTVSGGKAPYTVTLSNGGGTQTGAGPVFTFVVNPASTTTYTVDSSSVDANGLPIANSGTAQVAISNCPVVTSNPVVQTGKAPVFTPGLNPADIFYLGTQLQFISNSAGASFFTFSASNTGSFGVFPGYTGTTGLGFAATASNATSTALSCQDSPWDISLALAGSGTTAGDVVTIYLVQPNGTGRINLAAFTVDGTSASATVTSLLKNVNLSANAHAFATLGTAIPYSIPAGTAGNRSDLITISLPMDGTIPDCNLIGVDIKRAGGVGTTSVGLVDIQVTRIGSLASGTSVQGNPGQYPTELKCAAFCPSTTVCNSGVCYYDSTSWCQSIGQHPERFTQNFVVIPTENFGQPIRVVWDSGFGLQASISVVTALCDGVAKKNLSQQLLQKYLSAQLSLQTQFTFYMPQLTKQQLACQLMAPMPAAGVPAPPSALPVTLSTGVTLSGASTLMDLFTATDTALKTNNAADQSALLAIFSQFNTCRKD